MNKKISDLNNLVAGDVQDTDLSEIARPSTANYKFTWANLKAALKTYFDTVYSNLAHKTRHQDGGADEINIAGLAGEPAELTTHKAVETAGIHGSTSAATANKLAHRDSNGRLAVADGSASGDAVNKGQLDLKANDADVMKKDGSVGFTGDVSMSGYKLTNLGAPVSDNDAARKIDVDSIGVGSAKSIIPFTNRNMLLLSSTTSAQAVDQGDAATVMRVGQVVIPFKITVNHIVLQAADGAGDGSFKFAIFSEDGQTRHISESMQIGTDNDSTIHNLASPVTLSAGVYYVAVVPTAAGVGFTHLAWKTTTNVDAAIFLNAPAGLPVMEGTLTVTSGTIPATINPTAITAATDSTFVFRLDN
jgi:hypothetical protein